MQHDGISSSCLCPMATPDKQYQKNELGNPNGNKNYPHQ